MNRSLLLKLVSSIIIFFGLMLLIVAGIVIWYSTVNNYFIDFEDLLMLIFAGTGGIFMIAVSTFIPKIFKPWASKQKNIEQN